MKWIFYADKRNEAASGFWSMLVMQKSLPSWENRGRENHFIHALCDVKKVNDW